MLHEHSEFRISSKQKQVLKNALHMSKTATKTIQESETKCKLNKYQILNFQIELAYNDFVSIKEVCIKILASSAILFVSNRE